MFHVTVVMLFFFHVTEISIHNILFQSLKFKDVTIGLSSAPTFVPYSIFSERNTILIKEAVMLLVTTAIVAIPVQVHKKANDRAGMDFGIRSPYLKENHHHENKILIHFRSLSAHKCFNNLKTDMKSVSFLK